MYEQFSDALHQKYPDLNIQGDNFPPGAIRLMISQIMGYARLILIGLIIGGQNPFAWLNMQTPSAWSWAMENKVGFSICYLWYEQMLSSWAITVIFDTLEFVYSYSLY